MDRLIEEHFGRFNVSQRDDQHSDESDNEDESVNHDETITRRMTEFIQSQNDNESSAEREAEENSTNGPENEDIFTCTCSRNCLETFSNNEIDENIFQLRELSKEENEMFVMGVLQKEAFGSITRNSNERKRMRYSYSFKGVSICRDAFLKIYDVSRKVLSNIMTHMKQNGAIPREHGNKGKKPVHALKFEEIENAVNFIKNYADEFGIPQPEAPRGSDGIPPIYLPASDTKKAIHQRYLQSCDESHIRALKISSFEDVWLKCVPHIRISTPRDDVCQKCERLRKKIVDARTEEEKLSAVREFQNHIEAAKKERHHYRECIQEAVKEMESWQGEELKNVHYTFDFAQHFQLSHHARQMGPTYFIQLRRVQPFGVRFDSAPLQLNFFD